MEFDTAKELQDELNRLDSVRTTDLVHFEDKRDVHPEYLDTCEKKYDDSNYGVHFYAYDSYIPEEVIKKIAEYNTGGIVTSPDIGVVSPV